MKVAIQCESPLLQRSLELFMKDHLSSLRQCDIVIRDRKGEFDGHMTFLIGSDAASDLIKPFSKAQLVHAVQTKLEHLKKVPIKDEVQRAQSDEERVSFEILERHIDKLTREYQANIIKAIRAFYEK